MSYCYASVWYSLHNPEVYSTWNVSNKTHHHNRVYSQVFNIFILDIHTHTRDIHSFLTIYTQFMWISIQIIQISNFHYMGYTQISIIYPQN